MLKKRSTIYKKYIFPAIGGMLGTSLYVLGDTILVGRRLGAIGLASLNVSIPLINVLNGLGLLIGMGGASLMSIHRVRDENIKANTIFTKSMIMSLITGLLLTILSLFFTSNLVNFLGQSLQTKDLANDYLSMLLKFSPFFLVFVALTVFVRNDGGNKTAMAAMIGASVFNVVMDYVFLFPLDMGMKGCALATGLAQVVGLLILSTHFFRSKFKFIKINSIKGLFEILSNGGASFVLELSQGIVIFAFNFAFIKLAGDLAVSVYGIVANLSLLFTAILIGIANGIQPLISKAYGKRRRDMKVFYAKTAAVGAVVAGLIITAIGLLIPEYLAMAFVENEPEIILKAAYGIRLYFLAFPLVGINLVITIYLQSQKQTTKAFIFSLLRGLILIIVLLLILSPTLKIPGVWLVMPITEVIALIVGILLVRTKKGSTQL